MKKSITLFLIIAPLLFASCAHIYEPALYHQDIVYQPKPTSFDTVKSANYISAGYQANSNSNYNDFLQSGQLNVSQGYIFNGFNIAYGAFGVLGDYQSDQDNKNEANYFTHKFFGDVGGRLSANAFTTSGNVDIRFIGVEAAYSHEFGAYADLRQYLNKQPGYYVDPRTNLLSIGLSSEVIFHNREDSGIQHGIRILLGTTLGHDNLTSFYDNAKINQVNFLSYITFSSLNIIPRASYFIKFKKYFGTVEIGNAFFLRFGYVF